MSFSAPRWRSRAAPAGRGACAAPLPRLALRSAGSVLRSRAPHGMGATPKAAARKNELEKACCLSRGIIRGGLTSACRRPSFALPPLRFG
jgi:hypothetical protein